MPKYKWKCHKKSNTIYPFEICSNHIKINKTGLYKIYAYPIDYEMLGYGHTPQLEMRADNDLIGIGDLCNFDVMLNKGTTIELKSTLMQGVARVRVAYEPYIDQQQVLRNIGVQTQIYGFKSNPVESYFSEGIVRCRDLRQ